MRVGASRTAPDLTITAPHRSALAPAAQPRPASPRRALPSARVSKRVPIPRKSGVPVQCSLTDNFWCCVGQDSLDGDIASDPGDDADARVAHPIGGLVEYFFHCRVLSRERPSALSVKRPCTVGALFGLRLGAKRMPLWAKRSDAFRQGARRGRSQIAHALTARVGMPTNTTGRGDVNKIRSPRGSGAGPFPFANVHFSGVARSCARMLSFQRVVR